MSRIEQPSQLWLCGLLIGLLIKSAVVIAAETTRSLTLMQLAWLDPGIDVQAAVADWVFGRWFEPCCFGCLRMQIVFDTALILGFAVECAIAGWLLDRWLPKPRWSQGPQ